MDFALFSWLIRTCTRLSHARLRWLRRPDAVRVAVVGAGWGGLQTAARLVELGVEVEVFEQRDEVGGTWHPSQRYHGLRLHTPAWAAQFADGCHAPTQTPPDLDERPSVRAATPHCRTH